MNPDKDIRTAARTLFRTNFEGLSDQDLQDLVFAIIKKVTKDKTGFAIGENVWAASYGRKTEILSDISIGPPLVGQPIGVLKILKILFEDPESIFFIYKDKSTLPKHESVKNMEFRKKK